MTIRLVKKESLHRGLRRIAAEQIDALIAEMKDPGVAAEVKVHEYRKCCKRVRALLRLGRNAMDLDFKAEDDRFRQAARALGDLRDQHVQALVLAGFTGDPPPPVASCPADVAMLKKALQKMRAARKSVGQWPIRGRGFGDLAPGFENTYAKCREAWQRAGRVPSDHRFHRFRRWAKYHRYQVNMLELANRARMREYGERLERLGDLLGDAHDLAVLQASLEQDRHAPKKLVAAVTRRKQELYAEALALGRRCLHRRPEKVTAELAGWWAGWRG